MHGVEGGADGWGFAMRMCPRPLRDGREHYERRGRTTQEDLHSGLVFPAFHLDVCHGQMSTTDC